MRTFCICGIDPGIHTGVSILKVDIDTLDIVDITTHLLELDSGYNGEVGREIHRSKVVSNRVTRILDEYDIRYLGIETAFVNRSFPQSGLVLAFIIGCIVSTATGNGINNISFFSPKEVKKSFATATANKKDMLDAAALHVDMRSKLDVNNISEHEVDATAIALLVYTRLVATVV